MTILCAMKSKGNVWIATIPQHATRSSDAPPPLVDRAHQWVKLKNACIGVTGSRLFHTVMAYLAEKNQMMYHHGFDSTYDVMEFFDAYYSYLKSHYDMSAFYQRESRRELLAEFLVATPAQLYRVSCNRDVQEIDHHVALGYGSDRAEGAMEALILTSDNPGDILKKSCAIALKLDSIKAADVWVDNVRSMMQTAERPQALPKSPVGGMMTYITSELSIAPPRQMALLEA